MSAISTVKAVKVLIAYSGASPRPIFIKIRPRVGRELGQCVDGLGWVRKFYLQEAVSHPDIHKSACHSMLMHTIIVPYYSVLYVWGKIREF